MLILNKNLKMIEIKVGQIEKYVADRFQRGMFPSVD